MTAITWSGDGRPEFVPTWIPSVDAIKDAGLATVDNAKENLTSPTKNKMEAAVEVSLVLTFTVGFLMTILGFGPGVPPWYIPQIVGLALIVIGAFFAVTSLATLARSSSVLPTTTGHSTLITEGVFSHCRHPGYFGLISFCVGLSLLTLSSSRLIWTVIMWLALEKQADIEEMILADKYPEYIEYAATLPKFIPGRLVTGRPESFATLSEDPGSPHVVVDKIAE